ncbi:hypothetical protein DPMN_011759 [Dreissena polymorpha]|uniref:Uncharacterized protein n=1 Tax=Dreissena polymorpha TaxID=45954 RepID=A0A9D4N4Q8_DREPO|nr:hypothetical protein DPMN_011759 [Dreissena polymorpha]
MFKEKVNAWTHTRRTQDHDISPAGLWPINILTKFHKDWMKTVTSIVYTSDLLVFDLINILTKFHKDWMKTINILTKFHKDWMKTATSTVYTNKLLTDAHTHACTHIRTPDITRSHKLTMSLRDR